MIEPPRGFSPDGAQAAALAKEVKRKAGFAVLWRVRTTRTL